MFVVEGGLCPFAGVVLSPTPCAALYRGGVFYCSSLAAARCALFRAIVPTSAESFAGWF